MNSEETKRGLTIWCNADLSDEARSELEDGTAGHLLEYDDRRTSNLSSGGRSESLAEADIAFGQPDPAQIIQLGTLRWVHLTSAGYTRYDRADLRDALVARGAALTNSSSVFDEPCAQHLLAFMLANARQIPASVRAQGVHEWAYPGLRSSVSVLRDQTVLILGYGAIAKRLGELLMPFRLKVMAVRRHVSGDEPVEVRSIDELDKLLPIADHVVSTLPAGNSTNHLMDERRFGLMKSTAVFYNIGRGATVDQTALTDALNNGGIAGALLDVTDPEPLSKSDPLWLCQNCTITPHIGGGMQHEDLQLVSHFLSNLELFVAGQPLQDRVF